MACRMDAGGWSAGVAYRGGFLPGLARVDGLDRPRSSGAEYPGELGHAVPSGATDLGPSQHGDARAGDLRRAHRVVRVDSGAEQIRLTRDYFDRQRGEGCLAA